MTLDPKKKEELQKLAASDNNNLFTAVRILNEQKPLEPDVHGDYFVSRDYKKRNK